MPQVINTNVMSLNAQRNLTTSGTAMGQAIQRLSSGLRINSAKDDAAGLAISDRMTTQISGLNQAVRNANDGISLAQTTEGALQEVTNNLQRIRELSVQAANATNSASDLAALDQEVQQRIAEVNRIATQTSFNGRKVLDGSFGGATFQVGANVGETITLQLDASVKSSAIGAVATATGNVDLNTLITPATAGTPAVPATAGYNVTTGTITNFDFSGAPVAAVDGTSDAKTLAVANYGAAQVDGTSATFTLLQNDYSAGAATFAVDGETVTINTNLAAASDADRLLALNTAIDATALAGTYTATSDGAGNFTISNTGSTAAVAITAVDAAAQTATGLAGAGDAGNAGSAAVAALNFTVDGVAVTLDNGTYANLAALAADIDGQLANHTVAVNGADITITNTGNVAAVAITGADGAAIAAGITNSAGVAGSAAQAGGNAAFTVGGNAVALTTNVTDIAGLVTAVQTQLNAAAAGTYTVTGAAGKLTITNVALGTAGPAIVAGTGGAAFAGTATAGAAAVAAVPGTAAVPLTLAANAFTVAVGADTAVDLAGTYNTAQELADAVNSKVAGAFASVDETTGFLSIKAVDDLTIVGGAAPGMTAGVQAASGSLVTANVKTTAAANDTILAIDSALTTVSTFRSTLGAIQNRFQSTINSLSAVSENLSASRSRILDTDFAAETAAMTRAQILQQAGTAMVAQANSVPQNVLSLLR